MYLHHTIGLKLQSCKIRFSRSPIKIIAYVGAILVPIAAPLSCLKKDKLCSKILFFNTNSAKSIMESVSIVLSSLDSKDFLNAIKHSSCGIFGYKPTTSIVHRIMPSGKRVGETSYFPKKIISAFNIRFNFLFQRFKVKLKKGG